ncbi:hypothetical protein [Bacillus pumilus]|nr:hypothetical protein [Bacillus pumilus]
MEFKPSENMSYEGLWMALDDIKRRIGDAVLRRFNEQAKQAE